MSPAARSMALAKLKVAVLRRRLPRPLARRRREPRDRSGRCDRQPPPRRRAQPPPSASPASASRSTRANGSSPRSGPAACSLFHQNAYNFTAALLQPPKFDPSASDAANYGAIGAIVGHEVSHFVDTTGRRLRRRRAPAPLVAATTSWRATGRPPSRWCASSPPTGRSRKSPSTASSACPKTSPTSAAWSPPSTPIAAGSAAAPPTRITCAQQDRQFFIGFARAWRAKYTRRRAAKAQAATDHAPESYRVSTVRNLDAWYDAFDVKPGQRLYLEPAARVRIW